MNSQITWRRGREGSLILADRLGFTVTLQLRLSATPQVRQRTILTSWCFFDVRQNLGTQCPRLDVPRERVNSTYFPNSTCVLGWKSYPHFWARQVNAPSTQPVIAVRGAWCSPNLLRGHLSVWPTSTFPSEKRYCVNMVFFTGDKNLISSVLRELELSWLFFFLLHMKELLSQEGYKLF